MKRIILILILLVFIVTLLANCQRTPTKSELEQQFGGEEYQLALSVPPLADTIAECYDTIAFENPVLQVHAANNKILPDGVLLISSAKQLQKIFPYLSTDYSADFFKDNVLLLGEYTHSFGPKILEISAIYVQAGKIYPIIKTDVSFAEDGAIVAPILCYTVISAEIARSELDDLDLESAGGNIRLLEDCITVDSEP